MLTVLDEFDVLVDLLEREGTAASLPDLGFLGVHVGSDRGGHVRVPARKAAPEFGLTQLFESWRTTVGGGDLEVELRSFLIHDAGPDLRNPVAALNGSNEGVLPAAAEA